MHPHEVGKNLFLNKENAPHCYDAYLNCDHHLLIDTFERIKNKKDIFKNINAINSDKIRTIILPALINDKMIIDDNGELKHLVHGLMFNSSEDKFLFIQQHHKFVKNICDKVDMKRRDNIKIFEYISKNVPIKEYEKIINDLEDIKNRIENLKESQDGDTIDCEFSILSCFETNY